MTSAGEAPNKPSPSYRVYVALIASADIRPNKQRRTDLGRAAYVWATLLRKPLFKESRDEPFLLARIGRGLPTNEFPCGQWESRHLARMKEYPSGLIGMAEVGAVAPGKEESIKRILDRNLQQHTLPKYGEPCDQWLDHVLGSMQLEGWLRFFDLEFLVKETMNKAEGWVADREQLGLPYNRDNGPAVPWIRPKMVELE